MTIGKLNAIDRLRPYYLRYLKLVPGIKISHRWISTVGTIISRFLSKYSSVLKTETTLPDCVLMVSSTKSPKGQLCIYLVNRKIEPLEINLQIDSWPEEALHLYQISKEIVLQKDFQLSPIANIQSNQKNHLILPSRSITTISSTLLKHDDMGIISN